jgi:hypothetical protein
MAILYDARGNEWQGSIDQIVGGSVADSRTLSVTLSTLNSSTIMELNGQNTAVWALSGTWSGVVSFFAAVDGVNYFPISVTNYETVVTSSTVSDNGLYMMNCAGFQSVQAQLSSYISGALVISSRASTAQSSVVTTSAATSNVDVVNTPAVTISGTPDVNAAVSSVAGTVAASIAGTVNVDVTNTPSVNATISGTPSVNAAITNSPTVAVSSVSGTVTTSISGTPSVNIANSPTVAVSSVAGTVATSIAGTVNTNSVVTSVAGTVNVQPPVSNLCVTATGAAGAAVTATLPAPGAGLFHFISLIQIQHVATAALTAAATPVLVTTTNLNGPIFDFQANAAAQGVSETQFLSPTLAIQSAVANTATTIVCPATPNVIWRVNVFYYTAI